MAVVLHLRPRITRPMDDLSNLKGRIGEAFVEKILYRARYKVSRLGRESQPGNDPHACDIAGAGKSVTDRIDRLADPYARSCSRGHSINRCRPISSASRRCRYDE
jgi:hypothetical protein